MLNAAIRNRLAFASVFVLFAFTSQDAMAVPCTVAGPVAANAKTTVVYDPVTANMKACIGGTWLDMSGGGGGGNLDGLTDVTIASPSTNQALVYNGTAWVNATLSLTETDPKVGALTGNQWCAANAGGTAIVCNQAAPSGGGSSSGTAGFVQISGGSGAFASSSTTAGQQLFWDSTNHRLGIGVNAPTTQLTIGTSGTVTVQNGGSAAAPAYAVTTGGLGVNGMFVPAANSVAFVTSATERVRIDGSGNLGVGTTGPSAKLHVSGGNAVITPGAGNYATTFTGAGASALSITGGIANNEYARLTFGNGTAGNYAGIGAQITSGGSYLLLGTSNNYGTGITNEAIVISPTGNVGVGLTPNGAATLHVKGNAPVLALEGTDHAYQSWYPAGYAAGRKAWLGFGGAGTSDFGIWNETATGAINLATNGGSRIYIKADGNVGIGTATSVAPLEVKGANGSGEGLRLTPPSAASEGGQLTLMDGTGAGGWEIDNSGTGPTAIFRVFRDKGVNNTTALTLTPTAALNITGDINAGGNVISNGSATIGNGTNAFSIFTLYSKTASGVGQNPYVQWYRDGTRQAYLGWGVPGTEMQFALENGNQLYFITPSGARFSSDDVRKPSGGVFVASSDARLKDIGDPYTMGLDALSKLSPVNYRYKKDNPRKEPSDKNYVGFIAQDVQKVFPSAVREERDGYLSLDSSEFTYALINAVKELKAENDTLKAQLDSVNQRLEKLEAAQ